LDALYRGGALDVAPARRLWTAVVVEVVLAVLAWAVPARADGDFAAAEHERRTIYRSAQKAGFTSWAGAWTMPDGDLMVSFTQATGPLEGRPRAPIDVQKKLAWPPEGESGYDMTGLDLRNVHLRSSDAGKTWKQVSADRFRSCMNGVTGEAETALPDGTVLRGVWGFYLPYDRELPKTGYLERSADGTKTWGGPEVLLDPKQYSAWPRRIRVLRDGRLVVLLGVAPVPAGSHTRTEFASQVEPMLVVSSDNGKTWKGPIPAVPRDQRGGWTEEFDVAELPSGDLLCVFRRARDEKRWQGLLKKTGETWVAQKAGPSVLPHSGQPELLATREGPILHVATSGIHWTINAGKTWQQLKVKGANYYPRAIQAGNGRIFVFGHVGGDDPYGKVDQSVVMDSFRLRESVAVVSCQALSADRVEVERVALGEPDDYKPCVALLPGGELRLTAFHQPKKENAKVLEQTLFFRSRDGGRTWSKPQKLDLLGREPYLTVLADGTLFLTGHLLANDVRNRHGYTHGYLHRSTDAGKTWDSIRIESEGVRPKASNHSTRNVLQLDDGTLLLGVDYDGGDGPYLMWRSRDNGKTWDRTGKCQPRDFKSQYGFFGGETWLWQARSGKIWALVRVNSNELPIKGRPIKAGNDQADHFLLFSSADGGKTFDRIGDLGDYGEMYLSILRLQDKRLMLTFTVRDLAPPLGVRAVPGVETKDGFAFDLSKDRVMLDTRTPPGRSQGGGFGPTVQLKDGTLVTSYSYRGTDDSTHLEVVRWKLPPEGANVPEYAWERVTDKAAFAPRDGAGALTFQGRMWLLGGWNPGDKKHFPRICGNEVWSSVDGKEWRRDKPNTFLDKTFDPARDWEGRHTAGYVVYKDRMWIVGGDVNQGHYHFDVWNSADGKEWTLVNKDKPVPWGPRALHYTVVHDGKIWVIGGQTIPSIAKEKETFYRDVWNTTDGVHWTQVKP